MSSQHKRPLLAFVAVALLCGFVLGNAARGQAMGALAQVVPQVVVVTRVDKIAPLVVAGSAAVVPHVPARGAGGVESGARPAPEQAQDAETVLVAARTAPAEDATREGRRETVGRAGAAQVRVADEDAREQRREAREDRREAREDAREDREDAREDAREERRETREDRREAREDRREAREEARRHERQDREKAREDRREWRQEAREDRRDRRDDRRDRGRSHRR